MSGARTLSFSRVISPTHSLTLPHPYEFRAVPHILLHRPSSAALPNRLPLGSVPYNAPYPACLNWGSAPSPFSTLLHATPNLHLPGWRIASHPYHHPPARFAWRSLTLACRVAQSQRGARSVVSPKDGRRRSWERWAFWGVVRRGGRGTMSSFCASGSLV